MSDTDLERCNCPEAHPTPDGRCENASLRSEGDGLEKYTECGCCMADCPDVHPGSDGSRLRTVPGSMVVAEEHVATLPEDKQRELRERAARGELRILPQAEMHAATEAQWRLARGEAKPRERRPR